MTRMRPTSATIPFRLHLLLKLSTVYSRDPVRVKDTTLITAPRCVDLKSSVSKMLQGPFHVKRRNVHNGVMKYRSSYRLWPWLLNSRKEETHSKREREKYMVQEKKRTFTRNHCRLSTEKWSFLETRLLFAMLNILSITEKSLTNFPRGREPL